ncbi:RBBP9/YdeN family alpha/beta hydrolase [Microbulbifer sp. VTAC004]|uniref:RBBP9/YdeN family alpha/beta hydrolase n=1 Tax=unclassified Microbulbifer TaxID=2619833 RepID=UPI00403A1EA6
MKFNCFKSLSVFLFSRITIVTILISVSTYVHSGPIVRDLNITVVHGYMSSPDDHWFPWLRNELQDRGITTEVLSLPNPSVPNPEEWQETLSDKLGKIDSNSIVVAHSLGCIATLNYLNSLKKEKHIAGLVLVSGFISNIPNLPQLDGFTQTDLDFSKLILAAGKIIVIGSPQDSIVPFYLTEELADQLQATIVSIPDSGHFLASDGFRKFPQLLTVIDNILKNELVEK